MQYNLFPYIDAVQNIAELLINIEDPWRMKLIYLLLQRSIWSICSVKRYNACIFNLSNYFLGSYL